MTRLIASGTSPAQVAVNVMRLFPASSRRRLSHGHRHYSTPNLHKFSIDSLVNLIKIHLFIILSFYYRMKIWQRHIVGHVQITFIVNQSNLILPDSESRKHSKVLVWNILIRCWNSRRWKLQRSSVHDLLCVNRWNVTLPRYICILITVNVLILAVVLF